MSLLSSYNAISHRTEPYCIFYLRNVLEWWISGKSFDFNSQQASEQNRTGEAGPRMADSHPCAELCCGSGNLTAVGTPVMLWVPSPVVGNHTQYTQLQNHLRDFR